MKKIKLFLVLFFLFIFILYLLDHFFFREKELPKKHQEMELSEPKILLNEDLPLKSSSNDFYQSTLLKTRFNGAILVAKSGRIVFEQYNGLKGLTKGDPIDTVTSFHLASVSKTFTGMAVLKLWEEGMLQLDDDITTYLTGFPFMGISVRNLLSHRSGLPNYVHFIENMGWDTKKILTNDDLLQTIIENKHKLKPGKPNTYFEYCNTNYVLLALIIEKVSKLSYPQFLEKTFFKPIGMEHSFVFSMEKADSVLPSFKYNNQLEPFTYLDAVYGDKNIYSTPRDLLKWNLAINNGSLFKKQTLEEAFKGYSYERKGIRNYGLGWRLYEFPSGKKIIYHNGWWHGNNTVFLSLPKDSTTIIVLGNKYNSSIYKANKISAIFKGYDRQMNDND